MLTNIERIKICKMWAQRL